MVTVRYESAIRNFSKNLVNPFEVGMRHFKVAFTKDEKLPELAKERIIHRPLEANQDQYDKLSIPGRVKHFTLGVLETVGYLTIILPFITAIFDRMMNRPKTDCTSDVAAIRTHYLEGGSDPLYTPEEGFNIEDHPELNSFTLGDNTIYYRSLRENPFSRNGHLDPFYAGASWIPAAATTTAPVDPTTTTTTAPVDPETVENEEQDPIATIMNPAYDAFNAWIGQQQELENVPPFVQQGANITQAFAQYRMQNPAEFGPIQANFQEHVQSLPEEEREAADDRGVALRDERLALIAEERGLQIPA